MTKLTIYSYEEHFVVDGPRTRRANLLNTILVCEHDLDTLPVGTYEYRFVQKGLKLTTQLTKIA